MIYNLVGNAMEPRTRGNKIIAHVCNDKRYWGLGFTKSIDEKNLEPRKNYLATKTFNIGDVHYVEINDNTWVANMIAMKGTRSAYNPVPLQYDGLQKCLQDLNLFCLTKDATIHIPRIGCGLAGGSWRRVREIIDIELQDRILFIYHLEI